MRVLGISAYYHDSAAALVDGGKIVAAAQEERFSRKRHDPRFPKEAINYCLGEAFLQGSDLDAVAFYDGPVLTFDRVVKSFAAASRPDAAQFSAAMRSMLGVKARVAAHVEEALGGPPAKLLFADHHLSHAASAFYPSPFEDAAILTVDGVGEWATCSLARGSVEGVEILEEIRYPHSLGLLYSAFTYYCGFKVNSGEYKLMGLAPYGEPVFADKIRDHLIDLRPDGSFRLNMEYFGFVEGDRMTSEAFDRLFGGPARAPETRITRREMDLARSIQVVLEDAMLALARRARERAGSVNLALAGGVALNCVANGRVLREGIFDKMWIQPAAGDAGGALGCALLAAHSYFGEARPPREKGRDGQKGSYLGPRFSGAEVRAFLSRNDYPYRRVEDEGARVREIAEALAAGKVVGYFSGRMEFGPRSLGARSILGDPRRADTQSVVNTRIKFRESFRPFAPSVRVEDVGEYFELGTESPYMLLVAPVKESRRKPFSVAGREDMIAIVNEPRSDIPAVTHVDYSARVQTVHPDDHPAFHRLLTAFKEETGYGVLVNTSFNVRGEPIVCTPKDAYRCFMRTDMDLLVLEDCLLDKAAQPAFEEATDWRTEHELD
ncbi:MAG: carbamoyltransferase [Polyangiaceae bacterium]